MRRASVKLVHRQGNISTEHVSSLLWWPSWWGGHARKQPKLYTESWLGIPVPSSRTVPLRQAVRNGAFRTSIILGMRRTSIPLVLLRSQELIIDTILYMEKQKLKTLNGNHNFDSHMLSRNLGSNSSLATAHLYLPKMTIIKIQVNTFKVDSQWQGIRTTRYCVVLWQAFLRPVKLIQEKITVLYDLIWYRLTYNPFIPYTYF